MAKSRVASNRQTKEMEGKPVPTIIDGEKVEDHRQWVKDKIELLQVGRDVSVQKKTHDTAFNGHKGYVARVITDHELYHDIGKHLLNEGLYEDDDREVFLTENFVQQAIRDKNSSLSDTSMSIQFKPIDGHDKKQVDFVHQINQVVPVRLEEEGKPEARSISVNQTSIYGTSVYVYLADQITKDRFFECLDPLGFLFDYGRQRLNGRRSDTTVTSTFIMVRMRRRADIKREWGKNVKLKDNATIHFVKPEEFNLAYAMNTQKTHFGNWGETPEVTIFYRDTTTEPVVEFEPIMEVVRQDNNEPELTVDGDEVTIHKIGIDGEPEFREVKTDKRRLKYPDYRMSVFAGNQRLFDGEMPYDHGMIPAFKFRNTFDGTSGYGMSDPQILGDTQLAISTMDAKFQDIIEATNLLIFYNTAHVKDPMEDMIVTEKGISFIPLEDMGKSVALREVYQKEEPVIMSQDQVMYREGKKRDLFFLAGSSGKNFASESGRKQEILDEKSQRFNSAYLVDEALNERELGVMFLYNLRQFDDVAMPYPLTDKNRVPIEPIQFAGNMDGFTNEAGEGIDFPVSVHFSSSSVSNPDQEMARLIEIKGAIGGSLSGTSAIDDEILMMSGNPELMKAVVAKREFEAAQAKLLEDAEQAGVTDAVAGAAQASGGQP